MARGWIASLVVVMSFGGCEGPPKKLVVDDAVADGRQLVERYGCRGCHDPGDGSLAGGAAPVGGTGAWGANLTPDRETGIGGWSDDQIVRAVREGVDDEGAPLCPTMPRFAALTVDQGRTIAAYLRSLPPVRASVPESVCPPSDVGWPPLPDGGAPADLGGSEAGDLGSPDLAASSACGLRINEVQTAGSAGADDEFVELVNPCPAAAVLDGWRLVYRAAAGATDVEVAALAGSLAPGGRLVVGGRTFAGPAQLHAATSLASGGGGLGLRDGAGTLRDSFGWGTATNGFVRGTPAPPPPAARALARHPDGAPVDDDAVGFVVAAPTPGAVNP